MRLWQKVSIIGGAIVVVAVGALGVAVQYRRSSEPSTTGPSPASSESEPTFAADTNESLLGDSSVLAGALGCNQPAPPPVSFSVGPPSDANTPDLSSPAMAVYSVLSLIDRQATDALPQCFVGEVDGPSNALYPRYVGQPIGLVDVTEDEESAEVIWEATVHAAFSRNGKDWTPGESLTLTTRLVRIDGVWRLDGLCE